MKPTRAQSGPTKPAVALSEFAAQLTYAAIPAPVIARAKLQILDALGVGLAANAYPFAEKALSGIVALGGTGDCSVIGRPFRLSPRDAALANGFLVHGLDFDDTHLASIVHPTAACLPASLAVAEAQNLSGRDLLVAYSAAMETAIRIGLAVDGAFHHAGFHATGIVAHFSSALAAGKLMGLDAAQMTAAQGIAASTAAGVQVFLEEGAWTKRLHPAWAATAGITAATLAKHGFAGPTRPYEGKFGLFDTHLQAHAKDAKLDRLTAGLGDTWELAVTAIKPYPVCHFIHGAADAAIALSSGLDSSAIEAIEIRIPKATLPIVAEPAAAKQTPKNDYEAKFSAQFVVATCLARGRFGLAELRDEALVDPGQLALAAKATCVVDPDTAFPKYFSGGVTVKLKDGRVLSRYERVNSGAGERMLDEAGVSAKFLASAEMSVSKARAARIREVVLALEAASARDLGAALAGA